MFQTDRRSPTDIRDTERTGAHEYYLILTTITRLHDKARQPTSCGLRLNGDQRLFVLYDRRNEKCFLYAAYGLLSPYVSAIILETASSFVCPDYEEPSRLHLLSVRFLHLFTFHVNSFYQTSQRVPKSPNDALRVARRLIIASPELPRYTTLVSRLRTAPVRFTKLLTTNCYLRSVTTKTSRNCYLRRPYDDQR